MKENKTEYIGSRFSVEEKEQIEKFIEEYNKKHDKSLTTSGFFREAVFSHMYHLRHPEYYYDYIDFRKNLINLNKIINKMLGNPIE